MFPNPTFVREEFDVKTHVCHTGPHEFNFGVPQTPTFVTSVTCQTLRMSIFIWSYRNRDGSFCCCNFARNTPDDV